MCPTLYGTASSNSIPHISDHTSYKTSVPTFAQVNKNFCLLGRTTATEGKPRSTLNMLSSFASGREEKTRKEKTEKKEENIKKGWLTVNSDSHDLIF